MKKTMKTMLALMAGALTFSACSSDEFADQENSNGAKLVTLTAYQEGDATTRAAIGTTTGTETTINWKSGDAIGVFASTGSSTQYTTTANDVTSASFTGTEVTDAAYALYPYQSAATSASNAISGVVIPTTQTATANSFDPAAAVMVGEISNGSVKFMNVCAFLKITTDAAYTKIVVTTNMNAPIAGTFKVIPSTGAARATAGNNTVTLVPSSGSDNISAGTYYIAIAPCTSKVMQFAVDCYTSTGVAKEKVKYYTTAGSFERKKDYNLTGTGSTSSWSVLDANLLPGWFSVSANKLVHFTKGNLYYDSTSGSAAYHLESAQNVTYVTLGQSAYTASHVCHFFWVTPSDEGSAATAPWAKTFGTHTQTTSDKFFCGIDNPMTVDGTEGLYALTGGSSSSSEWKYLINFRTIASSLYKYGVSVTTSAGTVANCLVIAPDNYSGTIAASYDATAWATAEAAGLVCLPIAGYRGGDSFSDGSKGGYYWSATPSASIAGSAYYMTFNNSGVNLTGGSTCATGCSVRLVK